MWSPRIAFDWKNQFEKLKKGHQHRALSSAARQARGRRRRDPAARARQDAAGHCQRWPRRILQGPVAEDMVETLRGIGGLHTLDDFAGHSTETTSPIGTVYKARRLAVPPNGPGITML